MSEHIERRKLALAKPENLVRLAKALRLHGCACGAPKCQQDIEEKIARTIERESLARHAQEGSERR
jgi:hypothetical protein